MNEKKILAVDDSAMIRKIISGAAAVLGYGLLEAGNGQEALVIAERQPGAIALVLLDINMPVMSGLEFLRAFRANPDNDTIPVAIVSTESESSSVFAAIKLGAQAYILKPFSIEEMERKIVELIGGPEL
ncbi:MAG: response regulator [Bacillota bacterium]